MAHTLQTKAVERPYYYATNLLAMDRALVAEELISNREFEQCREQVSVRSK